MTEGWDRRRFLTLLSLTASGSLAGCQNSGDTPSSTDSNQDTGSESSTEPSTDTGATPPTQTPPGTPAQLDVQVDVPGGSDSGTVSLPSLWGETNSIDDYQIAVTISTMASKEPVSDLQLLTDDSVVQDVESGGGDEVAVTVDPADLNPGTNNLYFTGETANGAVARSEPAEITKEIPSAYKIDFQNAENEELREEATDEYGEDYFQNQVGRQEITDDPLLTNYNTPEGIEYSEKEIDLAALEYWHDNDFPRLDDEGEIEDEGATVVPREAIHFVESIDEPDLYAEAKNNTVYMYPNGDFSQGRRGNFVFDQEGEGFSHSQSVGEALDWLHPYLFSWEFRNSDVGPISSEDEQYAAVLQEAVDRYTDIEAHFWAFDLPEAVQSTHGNGMVYDETNNEMRIMETIGGPETQNMSENEPQYHPLVEDSNYLDPEHEAFNSWWHPLRFAEGYTGEGEVAPGYNEIDFETAKNYASLALKGIASGQDDTEFHDNPVDPGVAVTNEYLADFTEKLRSWNENEDLGPEEFESIKSMSKLYNYAWEEDENYVLAGTVENPEVVTGVSSYDIDRIWSDREGAWDDMNAYLQGDGSTTSASVSM